MIRYILKKFLLLLVIFMCIFFLLPLAVIGISYNENFRSFIKQEDVIIKLYRHETDNVEELKLEEYLEGVLAAEMPAKFDIEALKAQAVTSRTYAISKVISGKKIHNVAHVCDTVHSQAYIDKSMYEQKFGNKKDEYIEKIRRAIDETRGEVLYYNNEIVNNALYFAISSGSTENSSEVFSFDEPYLRSVDSSFDQDAPNVTKEYVFSEDEFVDKINNKYSNANVKGYEDIEVLGYTESGSIYRIKLGNEVIRGLDFRYLFELNSSNIKMKKEDDNIIIKVRGYGHGVGLSQWGAGKMAELGYKYDEILKHYYSGIEIKKASIY